MKKALFLASVTIAFAACNPKQKDAGKTESSTSEVSITMPQFDRDSAFSFVKAQTDFGPRVPNSEAHKKCAAYLQKKLEKFCDTVVVQSFDVKAYDGKKLRAKNFIGSFLPEKENRIILAAHWDSRHIADHDPIEANRNKPIDGANDGASGVGVLLEIARQLSIQRPEVGVDIIFFDAEDYGTPASEDMPGDWWALGSQYWAKNPHSTGYKAMYGILLDMVGSPNAQFSHEYFSSYYASDIVSKVWGIAYQLGHGNYFLSRPANPITDDHYYVNKLANIKMIDIIHQDENSGTGFDPVWHTTNDNIQNISKETLFAVGTTVLATVYSEK